MNNFLNRKNVFLINFTFLVCFIGFGYLGEVYNYKFLNSIAWSLLGSFFLVLPLSVMSIFSSRKFFDNCSFFTLVTVPIIFTYTTVALSIGGGYFSGYNILSAFLPFIYLAYFIAFLAVAVHTAYNSRKNKTK